MDQKEPSVLDYVKARLTPWKKSSLPVEPIERRQADRKSQVPALEAAEKVDAAGISIPWRILLTLALALFGQLLLQPRPNRSWGLGLFFYLLAGAWLVFVTLRGEWTAAAPSEPVRRADPWTVRLAAVGAGAVLMLAAFLLLGGNRFTELNVLVWAVSVTAFVRAFWLDGQKAPSRLRRLWDWIRSPHGKITIPKEALLWLAILAVILFFRAYRLDQVPPEMNSDHAEKLLDVWDVLQGQTRIFFPRNTGREAIQFYLTVTVINLFNTGISFLSLKIGTLIIGLATLPFIYLLGKEVANKRVGMLAVILTGIAWWPNTITRVALRFSLYPLFVAPTLFFLIRALRTSNRNDFILAGLALGLGLHGYLPFRIMPFVVVAAVGLFLLHRASKGHRAQTILGLCILALIAFIVFLPLLRYSLDYPASFEYRAFSRLFPLPPAAPAIFLENVWKAGSMFFWDVGNIWPIGLTNRPALDIISAALFFLGIVLLLVRYVRKRNWTDLFLILSIPMLMLPSTLSLAFPDENPALNRTAGALVPVFIIAAISLEGFLSGLQKTGPQPAAVDFPVSLPLANRWFGWAVVILLLAASAGINYNLVFRQYQAQYAEASWNASEMGQVIHSFASTLGSLDSAWVVPSDFWVDTRLVGIEAGNPTRDYAIEKDKLADTRSTPGPKLFILKLEDLPHLNELSSLYPAGWIKQYTSSYGPNKNFWIFFVPETEHLSPSPSFISFY